MSALPFVFLSIESSGAVCDRHPSQPFNSIVSPCSGRAVLPPRLLALFHFLWATAQWITHLSADCRQPPLTCVTIVSPPAAALPSAADGATAPLVLVSTTPPHPPPGCSFTSGASVTASLFVATAALTQACSKLADASTIPHPPKWPLPPTAAD